MLLELLGRRLKNQEEINIRLEITRTGFEDANGIGFRLMAECVICDSAPAVTSLVIQFHLWKNKISLAWVRLTAICFETCSIYSQTCAGLIHIVTCTIVLIYKQTNS